MSEKKTFKNPWRLVLDFGYEYPHWNVYPSGSSSADECGAFSQNEWDMEVTFTKKEKPLAVGDVIKYDDYDGSKIATIMAIDDDQCWLKFSDGSHATWELDEVYR